MRTSRLVVDGFPGEVLLLESSSAQITRARARSVNIPQGWRSSRSYRGCYGLVAMAPERVGVDIEVLDLSVAAEAVLTRDERALEPRPEEVCRWWSAKEALAKALGDARNYDPRRLETPALWPSGHQGCWRAEGLGVAVGNVGWVVWETNVGP